jgi:3-isopropylmalate dehydrogenase
MNKNILCLAGDGIGPEIMDVTIPIVEKMCEKFGHTIQLEKGLVGYAAYDAHEDTMPQVTWDQVKKSDGILFGSVGLPDRDAQVAPEMRPEKRALLPLRKEMGLSVNIRPIAVYDGLENLSPLSNEIAKGVNLTFLRELNSGMYFGKRQSDPDGKWASDECYYAKDEIERIARFAFELSRQTGQKVTSIDKANVLNAIGIFWRETVIALHEKEYSDVELEHCLVDAFNLYMFTRPSEYRIVLTSNMYGDILSDGAAGIAGSLGLLPSASVNPDNSFCLYEPSGGTAPDIAGQNKANPIAMILSSALLFRHTYKDEKAASYLEGIVRDVLADGFRTGDLASSQTSTDKILGTKEFADTILAKI